MPVTDLTTLLSKFLVQLYAGNVQAQGNGAVGAPAYSFAAQASTGMYLNAASDLRFAVNGTDEFRLFLNGFLVRSDAIMAFSSTSSLSAAADTAFSRLGAASLALGNGTASDATGLLRLKSVQTVTNTVANLPAAPVEGM